MHLRDFTPISNTLKPALTYYVLSNIVHCLFWQPVDIFCNNEKNRALILYQRSVWFLNPNYILYFITCYLIQRFNKFFLFYILYSLHNMAVGIIEHIPVCMPQQFLHNTRLYSRLKSSCGK